MLKDLIAAEFKYPDRWRKDTMKDDRETSAAGGEVTYLKKWLTTLNIVVFKMNKVVSINVVHEFCYDSESDNINRKTVMKQK